MAKVFKNVRKTHVPFEPAEERDVEEKFNEFQEEISEAGQFLEIARKEKGWSRSELGKRAGVSADEIKRMESGEQPIPVHLAKRFGELFDQNYHSFVQ